MDQNTGSDCYSQATAEPQLPEADRPVPLLTDDPAIWESARQVLDSSGCVVFPTDTVYGIAARAEDAAGVAHLQATKGRSDDFPPPLLVADADSVWPLVSSAPDWAKRLAEAYWPGALTLILATDRHDLSLSDTVHTLGIRVPDLDWLRGFLRWSGPLAVSSANKHNLPPATRVEDAISQLGNDVGLYIDGGPTPGPVPSTVVDCTGKIKILRLGLLTQEMIMTTAGADA